MDICASNVYTEQVDFIPGTTEKTFILVKGRKGGVIEIVLVAVNPRGTAKMKNVNRVFKVRGIECDLDPPVDVDDETAKTYFDTIYVKDGEEFGLRIDGEAVDSTCRVLIQYLWFPEPHDSI